MYCSFIVKVRKTGKIEVCEFRFPGGYIGNIVPFAKAEAKRRGGVLLPFEGKDDGQGGALLVDCSGTSRNYSNTWIEVR